MVIDLMAISTVVALGPLHSSTLILLLSTRPGPARRQAGGAGFLLPDLAIGAAPLVV